MSGREESLTTQRESKEKVWHTIVNGGLKEVSEKGAPLWAVLQLALLWQIYQKLDFIILLLQKAAP